MLDLGTLPPGGEGANPLSLRLRGQPDKPLTEGVPLREQPLGPRASRLLGVQHNQVADARLGFGIERAVTFSNQVVGMETGFTEEAIVLVKDPRQTTGHASAKVDARVAKDSDQPASHVLAAVVANAFNHSNSPGVAHGKAFPRSSGSIESA